MRNTFSMANKLQLIFLCSLLMSCVGGQNEVQKYIAIDIITIKANLDSAAYLYDGALHDVARGLSHDSIVSRYQNRIKVHFNAIAAGVDTLGKLYTHGKIDSAKYEALINSVNSDTVGKKAEELRRLGIELNLN
ncbi:MAG: hypothetical protein JSS82_06170 [Bacteroidetes bacterium]|nr:hypothetical protein [Bacteroidota bacterium]